MRNTAKPTTTTERSISIAEPLWFSLVSTRGARHREKKIRQTAVVSAQAGMFPNLHLINRHKTHFSQLYNQCYIKIVDYKWSLLIFEWPIPTSSRSYLEQQYLIPVHYLLINGQRILWPGLLVWVWTEPDSDSEHWAPVRRAEKKITSSYHHIHSMFDMKTLPPCILYIQICY